MSNDRILLDEILEQNRVKRAPKLSPSAFLELFAAEQILKDFDLSTDEIESGLIGDGGDGGIDGFYLFANDDLVRDDFDGTGLKKDPILELVLIQTKSANGFADTPIERFITVTDDILDLTKPVTELTQVYNSGLIENITRYRATIKQLVTRFPLLRVTYHYVCKGNQPETSAQRKAEKLKQTVRTKFPAAEVEVHFVGAAGLLTLARRSTKSTYVLKLAENPVSSAGQVGFVCLVTLRDYFEFITDERKLLRKNLFEANVRDYQGRTAVNDAIQATLASRDSEDFWWLNNGVSILASRASAGAKELTIEDPQVVNGLQTSTEIHNYFIHANTDGDGRRLLIRVIVPSNAASSDKIIKATNSQTAVQQASLRATDKIHRDIEEYLKPRGIYYDRRKNFYRNEGKPLDSIIGIPTLAQAVMSILLKRPDDARARPSSLLKNDADYEKIYSQTIPINVYFVCATVLKKVDDYTRNAVPAFDARDRNNIRFYVAMYATYQLAGKWRPSPSEIAALEPSHLNETALEHASKVVIAEFNRLGGSDVVAKGPELVKVLEKVFAQEVSLLA